MRTLYSREDGSQFLFLRPGAPVCRNNVHKKEEVVSFASRGEAASLVDRLARDTASLAVLRALLLPYSGSTRLGEGAALRRLAELIWRGELVVHRRLHARTAYFLENAPEVAASAAPPPPPRPVVMEETDTFSPAHDALAQANALKEAAQSGVPFCEECARR